MLQVAGWRAIFRDDGGQTGGVMLKSDPILASRCRRRDYFRSRKGSDASIPFWDV
jgi:hypothetical protein